MFEIIVAICWKNGTWQKIKVKTDLPEIEWRDETILASIVEEQYKEFNMNNADLVAVYDVQTFYEPEETCQIRVRYTASFETLLTVGKLNGNTGPLKEIYSDELADIDVPEGGQNDSHYLSDSYQIDSVTMEE